MRYDINSLQSIQLIDLGVTNITAPTRNIISRKIPFVRWRYWDTYDMYTGGKEVMGIGGGPSSPFRILFEMI